MSYNEKFYKDVLEVGELAKLGKCIWFVIYMYLNVFYKTLNIMFEETLYMTKKFVCYKLMAKIY